MLGELEPPEPPTAVGGVEVVVDPPGLDVVEVEDVGTTVVVGDASDVVVDAGASVVVVCGSDVVVVEVADSVVVVEVEGSVVVVVACDDVVTSCVDVVVVGGGEPPLDRISPPTGPPASEE